MNRRTLISSLVAVGALSACTSAPPQPQLGPDGKPLPRAFRITRADARNIPFRALDAVNALRVQSGAAAVELDNRLTAAATTHSRDMSLQNRPWHFGSDGSTPIDRARAAGFQGRLLGEAISETYESELETIVAWGQDQGPRRVLLDRDARLMGFGFFQEQNGKIWWTLNMGTAPGGAQVAAL